MRRGLSEKDVSDIVDTKLARQYGRQIDRFFQGTVLSVVGSGPYTVTIQRTGEADWDGNTYTTVAFKPQVGDHVECIWRDNAAGYVLHPLNRTLTPASFRATLLASPVIPAGWGAVTPLDKVTANIGGRWNSAGYFWTPDQGGFYFISAQMYAVQTNPPAAGSVACCIYAGFPGPVYPGRQGVQATFDATQFVVSAGFVEVVYLNPGDVVQMGVVGGGGNLPISYIGGFDYNFLSIQQVGPA